VLEAGILRDILAEFFIKILPSAAPPCRSGGVLMVASKTPLPAGPPSTTGIFEAISIAAGGSFPNFGRKDRVRQE
jgi:hypothetical protein